MAHSVGVLTTRKWGHFSVNIVADIVTNLQQHSISNVATKSLDILAFYT